MKMFARFGLLMLALTGISWPLEAVEPAPTPARVRQPNIVLILFDWARQDSIGAYSDKPVVTPNLDALAEEGVRFENAYTPATLCSPARASILTGLYPHAHGVRKTMYPPGITGNLPTMYTDPVPDAFSDDRFNLAINFPMYLTNSGYATGYVGKWHLGAANPGFFDLFKAYNSLMPHWLGVQDASPYREDVQTDEGIRFVRAHADRPFFLVQSYYTPHGPYQPPARFRDLYAGVDIDHRDYYAAVSSLDSNVGRLVKALRDEGLLENTVLVVTADHAGSFRDRPGSHRGMGIAFDEAAKIPFIMHWPAGLPARVVWRSGVSLVDIAPTLLAVAGVNVENRVLEIITGRKGSPFQGRDLVTEVRSGRDDWPVPVFMENIPEASIDGSWYDERAMRTKRWKLILRDFNADPRVHHNALYDLDADPAEERNLYYDAAYRDERKALLERMLRAAGHNGDELSVKLTTAELEHPDWSPRQDAPLYEAGATSNPVTASH